MTYSGLRMETTGPKPAGESLLQERDRKALETMLEYVRSDARADGCSATLHCGGRVLQACAGINPPPDAADLLAAMRAECLRDGKAVDCADGASEARTANAEARPRAAVGAFVAVPVRAQGKTVGVVEMFSAQSYNFMPDDVHTAERVADAIAALVWRRS